MRILTTDEKEIAANLKARIWHTLHQQIQQETEHLGTTATPQFTAGLVELVYRQLVMIGEDLSVFAKHGNRKTILPEDMFMCVRRNEGLSMILKDYLIELEEKKKRKEILREKEELEAEAEKENGNGKGRDNNAVNTETNQDEDSFSDLGDYL